MRRPGLLDSCVGRHAVHAAAIACNKMTASRRRNGAPVRPAETRIRPEGPGDVDIIAEITREAFRTDPRSTHTEEFIIAGLRASGVLTVSLVAETNGQVIGHIALSPVSVSDGSSGWFALGPVTVSPPHQQSGTGTALVTEGLAALGRLGAAGCVVLGEPAFYGRFGFKKRRTLRLPGVPPEYFLARSFSNQFPVGTVAYHPAFDATS
jgi:putative acetyltransferase